MQRAQWLLAPRTRRRAMLCPSGSGGEHTGRASAIRDTRCPSSDVLEAGAGGVLDLVWRDQGVTFDCVTPSLSVIVSVCVLHVSARCWMKTCGVNLAGPHGAKRRLPGTAMPLARGHSRWNRPPSKPSAVHAAAPGPRRTPPVGALDLEAAASSLGSSSPRSFHQGSRSACRGRSQRHFVTVLHATALFACILAWPVRSFVTCTDHVQ